MHPHFIFQGIFTLPFLFILETACLVLKNSSNAQNPVRLRETLHSHNLPLPISTSALVRGSVIYDGRKISLTIRYAGV